jgi:C-terminal processing protease CtpA/Prc
MKDKSDGLHISARSLMLAMAVVTSALLTLTSARAQQDRTDQLPRRDAAARNDQALNDQSTQFEQRRQSDNPNAQATDRANQERAARSRGQQPDAPDRSQRQPATDRQSTARAPTQDQPDQRARGDQSRDQGTQSRDQSSRGSLRQRLGVTFEEQRQGQGGLSVSQVQQGTPAAQAGLRAGDQIVSIDGRNISSQQQFFAYLGGQYGRQIPVVINRNGQQYTIQLAPEPGGGDVAWLGVFLQDSEGNQDGAQVTQVYPAGPAARAGLRAGDIITAVDGQRIGGSADLIGTIEELQPGARAQLAISRNNQQVNVPVVLGSRESFAFRGQGEDQWSGPWGGQRGSQWGGPYAAGGHADRGQAGGGQYGAGGQYDQNDHFANLPPFAMQLEHERRTYEQHQRIETEIAKLQDEVRQLREAIQQLKR